MTKQEKLFFIVNPISGTKDKTDDIRKIKEYLDNNGIDYEIRYTERAGHATQLAEEAMKAGNRSIVAVGGDGTINEVASALTESEATLGIIPYGSGNGLARHIGIPIHPLKSLKIIVGGREKNIDYCSVNGKKYFCAFGTGYDAEVAHDFAKRKNRGLLNYIKSSVKMFRTYKAHDYSIAIGDEKADGRYYIASVCNASQYGNNAFIAPAADISDGLLDIVLIKDSSRLSLAGVSVKLFTKSIKNGGNIIYRKSEEITLRDKTSETFPAHIDGEPIELKGSIHIKCHRGALSIYVPQ